MNALFYTALILLVINLVVLFAAFIRLKDRFSSARILGDIRSEIDRLILDLGRETDRDVAILEDRIRGLRELMDEADRRILLADREESKRKTLPEIPAPEVTPEQTPEQTEPVIIYTKPRISRRESQIEPEIPVRERAIQMARKDISPEIIAKTLGISQGEVDLILTMNDSSL
ncbi:MAG TPA: hypothetical protein PLS27_07420 [Treponemataceae bacterium]|jgi:hypothetical protein|nr:hypothetical protein [Treponemataceae bacterium]HQB87993.1 hypothetical protein [Treponemataceae bacterium]HRR03165.1 hypothetical protein [Treponemataceae bacterium]